MDISELESVEYLQEKEKKRQYSITRLGGIRAVDTYTFENYQESKHNKLALAAALKFSTKSNLFIVGQVGTGKTHLAVAAARKFHPLPGVDFLRQADLSRQVRGADNASSEDRIIKAWGAKQVLILDDLGSAKDTEFMVGLLYEIIDWRYMNRPGGLIVTSNRTLDQLAEKLGDDRVPSRLAQMCQVFNLLGEPDHRLGVKA